MKRKGKKNGENNTNCGESHHNHSDDHLHLGNNLHVLLRLSVLNMEYIVDEVTGELIEKKDQNELAERKLNEVGAFDQETYDMIVQFLYYQEQYEVFRFKLEKAMRDNGIKKWENDLFTATVKEESLQKRVDTEHLKADGLYEKYLKLVPMKGGLAIKMKGGK